MHSNATWESFSQNLEKAPLVELESLNRPFPFIFNNTAKISNFVLDLTHEGVTVSNSDYPIVHVLAPKIGPGFANIF